MENILWLPSWYPSPEFPQNGDFIVRQAIATSKFISVSLFYKHAATDLDKDFEWMKTCNNPFFIEYILKFSERESRSIFFPFKVFRCYDKKFRQLFNKKNYPSLTHVHVCYKAGLFALWLKWKYKIPYVISEHWTIFTAERREEYSRNSWFINWILKLIYNNADSVITVSKDLSNNLRELFPNVNSTKISNVVDTSVFYKKKIVSTNFNFIHVSSGAENKNVDKIINSFILLSKQYRSMSLTVVGPISPSQFNFDINTHNENNIYFEGSISNTEVANKMQQANAFVLFSDYETQSCVSIEALCCGLPVISSRLPCIEEFITEDNGILVAPGDENALFKAMEDMYLNYPRYNRARISEVAQAKYNPEVIGKQIVSVYEEVLNNKIQR